MKLEVTSACAVLIWFMMPLWSSRFSFTMGTCFLAKLTSSCKRWFNTSVCASFSWAWSSFSLSSFSCHFSSAMSLMQASCSTRLYLLFWQRNTGRNTNMCMRRKRITLTFLDNKGVLLLLPHWDAVNFALQKSFSSFLFVESLLCILPISLQTLNQIHDLSKDVIYFLQ